MKQIGHGIFFFELVALRGEGRNGFDGRERLLAAKRMTSHSDNGVNKKVLLGLGCVAVGLYVLACALLLVFEAKFIFLPPEFPPSTAPAIAVAGLSVSFSARAVARTQKRFR